MDKSVYCIYCSLAMFFYSFLTLVAFTSSSKQRLCFDSDGGIRALASTGRL